MSGSAEMYCPSCERSFTTSHLACPDDGTKLIRLVEGDDPLLGSVIDGRFLLEERLGAGGMGIVYRAVDQMYHRPVAIKLIRPEEATSLETSKRFLREAKVMRQMTSSATVAILAFGQDPSGMLYLAMELLEGRELNQIIATEAPLSPQRVADIGIQLCVAMEAAHGLGIIHRDLKPENVIVTKDQDGLDRLKVLDFGIAKSLFGNSSSITQTNMILGTPAYVAPEAALGEEVDERADLYALGILLYELCAGMPPFFASTTSAMLRAHVGLTPPPLPPEVPQPLQELIFALLAKKRADRPASAQAVRRKLAYMGLASKELVDDDELTRTRLATARDDGVAVDLLKPPPLSNTTRKWLPKNGARQHRRLRFDWVWLLRPGFGRIVVIAAACLGLFTALAFALSGDDGEATPAAKPEASTDKRAPVKASAALRPTDALFHFQSEPAGAAVSLSREGHSDVELCKATPCSVTLRNPREPRGTVWFRLGGYAAEAMVVELSPGEHHHRVELTKVAPEPL